MEPVYCTERMHTNRTLAESPRKLENVTTGQRRENIWEKTPQKEKPPRTGETTYTAGGADHV